jgi:hypothetical protein
VGGRSLCAWGGGGTACVRGGGVRGVGRWVGVGDEQACWKESDGEEEEEEEEGGA